MVDVRRRNIVKVMTTGQNIAVSENLPHIYIVELDAEE